MRILVLSFYYPPDIGPGPLRAASLVEALLDGARQDIDVDVVTTVPNRYHSLPVHVVDHERVPRLSIHRIALPKHHSGMADQARAFLVYARGALKASRREHWDIVIATSSRLMTAALAAWVARRKGAKLYLDIRDLFTDTIEDVLSTNAFKPLLTFFKPLERWTFRSADRLNVVSAGFLPHIQKVAPRLDPRVFTNGTDDEFVMKDFVPTPPSPEALIVYAGNLGDGQGLHYIIPAVAKAVHGRARFRLIGDGGRRKQLEQTLADEHIENVEIVDPVARRDLLRHYREADVLFLHLNDLRVFHYVLPSKIFEYAATGKPILAGVAGYAADFLKEEVAGVEVFRPCDAAGMQACLGKLLEGPRVFARQDFNAHYSRKNIMREMAQDILAVVTG